MNVLMPDSYGSTTTVPFRAYLAKELHQPTASKISGLRLVELLKTMSVCPMCGARNARRISGRVLGRLEGTELNGASRRR